MTALLEIDRAALTSLCHEYGVAKLSLFGSALRGDFDLSRSDVDALVEFLPGKPQGLLRLLALQNALGTVFGRPVDLNTTGSLSKYFRDDVLAAAEVLYDAA